MMECMEVNLDHISCETLLTHCLLNAESPDPRCFCRYFTLHDSTAKKSGMLMKLVIVLPV